MSVSLSGIHVTPPPRLGRHHHAVGRALPTRRPTTDSTNTRNRRGPASPWLHSRLRRARRTAVPLPIRAATAPMLALVGSHHAAPDGMAPRGEQYPPGPATRHLLAAATASRRHLPPRASRSPGFAWRTGNEGAQVECAASGGGVGLRRGARGAAHATAAASSSGGGGGGETAAGASSSGLSAAREAGGC